MFKLSEELLAKIPEGERTYFKEWIEEYFKRCINDYNYLGFKIEAWQKILEKAIAISLNKENFYVSIKNKIEGYVKKYVIRNYEEGNIRVFNNMLKVLQAQSKDNLKVLKRFVANLKIFKMEINLQLLNFLKANSEVFRNILSGCRISNCSLEEFKKLVNGDFDGYIAISAKNKTLKEVIAMVNKLNTSYKDISSLKKYDIEGYNRLCLIINNHDKMGILKNLLIPFGYNLTEEQIMICLNNFSYQDVRLILSGVIDYSYGRGDDSFVFKFCNLLNKLNMMAKFNKTEEIRCGNVEVSNGYRYSEILQKLMIFMPHTEISVSSSIKRRILANIFRTYTDSEREVVIKYIYKELDKESRGYLRASNLVADIGEKYIKKMESKTKEKRGYVKKNRKRKSIYVKINVYPNMSIEEKIKFIDSILSEFSIDDQNFIKDYDNGLLDYYSNRARYDNLLSKVSKMVKERINILKSEEMDEAELREKLFAEMPLIEGVSIALRRETFFKIYETISESEKENLRKFYNNVGNKTLAKSLILRVGRNYREVFYVSKKKTLADRMPYVEGINALEKRKITMSLCELLPSDRREAIDSFFKDNKVVGDVYGVINSVKLRYKKYVSIRMRAAELLDNKMLCDKRLWFRLPIEEQLLILKLFKNELDIDSVLYIKALEVMEKMEQFLNTRQYSQGNFSIFIQDVEKLRALKCLENTLPVDIKLRDINSNSLSIAKINILIDYLKIIEAAYLLRNGNIIEYYSYANKVMQDIYDSSETIDLEKLYMSYIRILREELNLTNKFELGV